VQVIDKETGELIRQVPPEELLNVMQSLRALKGILLSRKS
jgi:flagellar protein FlaG